MRGLAVLLGIMTLAAVGISAAVTWRQQSGWRQLDDRMNVACRRGSHDDLQRARLLAMRLAIATPDDAAPEVALGMIDARLIVDFGHDLGTEARGALERAAKKKFNPATSALRDAARALLLMADGQLDKGVTLANAAIEHARSSPYGYWVLARIKGRQGDAAAAAPILQAAAVLAPDFLEIRVAWAKTLFDMGDQSTAQAAVAQILTQAPDMERAQLLTPNPTVCADPNTPEISAACTFRSAYNAWIDGDRARALSLAIQAADRPGHEPRRLAALSQVLAHMGHIDRASALLDKAETLTRPPFGAIEWAQVAIALGRGQAAVAPKTPASSVENVVTAVRLALTTAGLPGLESALADLRPPLPAALRALTSPVVHAPDPLRAYVDGLRARLRGDLSEAIRLFTQALDDHGDASHAAGELQAALQSQGQPLAPTLLERLGRVNRDCIHLHRAENVVIPAAKKRRSRP